MSNVLGRWGRQVYRLRWWLFGLSVLSLAPAIIVLAQGARLEAGTVLATTQSGRAADLMARQLPGQPVSFNLIFSSPTLRPADRAFREEVARALAPLKADATVARIRTAYDAEAPDPADLSRDRQSARAVVELKARSTGQASLEFSSVPPAVYASLRALVRSGMLDVVAAGMVPLNHDSVEVAKQDLERGAGDPAGGGRLPAPGLRFGGGGPAASRRRDARRGRRHGGHHPTWTARTTSGWSRCRPPCGLRRCKPPWRGLSASAS